MFEVRGPIGGHFSWTAADGGPLLLVGGGSGLVPLMSMLRHRGARASEVEAHAARLGAQRAGRALPRRARGARAACGAERRLDLHADPPPGWGGYARRVDAAMLAEVAPPPADAPMIFVCGPTPFVEAVADLLVDAGHDPRAIHAERFGPTGG